MIQRNKLAVCTLAALLLTACGGANQPTQEQRLAIRQPLFATEHKIIDRRSGVKTDLDGAIKSSVERSADIKPHLNSERNAYFGDLHVHTNYSFDAYAFGALATP